MDDCLGLHASDIARYYGVDKEYNTDSENSETSSTSGDDQINLTDDETDRSASSLLDVLDAVHGDFDLEVDPNDTAFSDLENDLENPETNTETEDDETPILVPDGANPFTETEMQVFVMAFAVQSQADFIPAGYGMQPSEWGNLGYPSLEFISIGRRNNETPISLPDNIWRPRAEQWVRGLSILTSLMYARTL